MDMQQKLKGPVNRFFTDHLMIVLALLLIPTTLLPLVFSFSQFMLNLFEVANYAIITVFVIEYFLKLYVADSRKAYASDPWHILDLIIVIFIFADFLQWFPLEGVGKASPMLRLLRIARVFAVAGRTVKRAVPIKPVEHVMQQVSLMKVNIFEEGKVIRGASGEDISHYIAPPLATWIDIQDFSEIDIDFVSNAISVPDIVLGSKVIRESYPRIDYFNEFTTIFIRDSKLQSDGTGVKDIKISRNNMLIICANNYIATISTGRSELFDQVVNEGMAIKDEELIVRILYSILRRKVHDYEEIVRCLEQKTTAMEDLPVGKARPTFLEDTFYLKKEIQKIHSNLWHFKQVLDAMKTKQVALRGLNDEHLSLFDILYDESVYLFETSENIKDNLISLIELHINTVSFGLNRVMRLLAVITSIALIPSIISGLLGENLIDSPYHISIYEIFFLVVSLMTLAAYAFYRHDWLR